MTSFRRQLAVMIIMTAALAACAGQPAAPGAAHRCSKTRREGPVRWALLAAAFQIYPRGDSTETWQRAAHCPRSMAGRFRYMSRKPAAVSGTEKYRT
jgi:hypothetical protein